MTNAEIVEALNNLVPDSEWVLVGDDYSAINWIKGNKPSLEAIKAEIALLPQKRAEKIAEAEAKKDAALNKLSALGLSIDELKALGLG